MNTNRRGSVIVDAHVELTEGVRSCPFPYGLSAGAEATLGGGVNSTMYNERGLRFVRVGALARPRVMSLTRGRLVDPRFTSSCSNETLLLSSDRNVDVVLYRRSRVGVRIVGPNLSLRATCTRTSEVSSRLGRGFIFTFSSHLNCLARYPAGLNANVETSILLRLPTLATYNRVDSVSSAMSGLNLAIYNSCNRKDIPVNSVCYLDGRMALNVSRGTTVSGLGAMALRLTTRREATETRVIGDVRARSRVFETCKVLGSTEVLPIGRFVALMSGIHLKTITNFVGIGPRAISRLVVSVRPTAVGTTTNGGLSDHRHSVRHTGRMERELWVGFHFTTLVCRLVEGR